MRKNKSTVMEQLVSFFKDMYQNFNDRKIDLVIDNMADDVRWANGMDGGYIHGRDEVRKYWTKQFGLVSSNVTPLQIEDDENGVVKIKVHQVVHDPEGKLLADEMIDHYFYLRNNRIARFEIGEEHTSE